jgi:GT2 family glycosyltransferase
MDMKYIIVTNTFKRSLNLVERSIKASLKQKLIPLKVILIDQNEEPLQLDEEIKKNPLFLHEMVNTTCVSVARNSLKIPPETDWIIFCDDDGFLKEDYSEKLNELIIQNSNLEIFAGSIIRDDNHEFYTLRQKQGGSLKSFFNCKLLMGSNLVVKKSTFEKLGRFDEQFGAGSYWGSSEETDFAWKAYFAKIPMEYFPELIVYHIRPYAENLWPSMKKAFRYGKGKGALVVKWLKKGNFLVFLELGEMFILPWIQFVRGLVTFQLSLIPINLWAMAGRAWGFSLKLFQK